ncbi:MAG: UPF0280 family protein [candidate division NC10 bacterium]|nr:UPF0280 family protein [candidate division NC10 bacterium]
MYQERAYQRISGAKDLVGFEVEVKETHLWIQAERDLSAAARQVVIRLRDELESYICHRPEFATSLQPLSPSPFAPPIVQLMISSAQAAKVGPMAAVAGAMAELVGKELASLSKEMIVENGGDIFLQSARPRVVKVYAGVSPFSDRLGLKVKSGGEPLGICTSAGRVGPSLSLGVADAAVILANSPALADAVATRMGNRVQRREDIPVALKVARSIPGVRGALLIVGEGLGAWGELEILRLEE